MYEPRDDGDQLPPQRKGEGGLSYMQRLAVHLGWLKPEDVIVPGLIEHARMKGDKPYLERLGEIFQTVRLPGQEG